MPIYEYQCTECGHALEMLQKISDPPATTCPACAKDALKKRVSASVFRLKGSGWYETDFKSGDKKKNLAGERSKDTGDAKKSPAKSGDSAKKMDAATPAATKSPNKSESSS